MRLLNTTDFRLQEFGDTDRPRYAILSHCWSQDPNNGEVTYQQFRAGDYEVDSYGWQKVAKCCEIALARGLEWAWIDTCCIDKTSSAELTETINSMYSWYKNSEECYVFLDDIKASERRLQNGTISYEMTAQDLFACRWITRGWTLQELLAPHSVYFFDRDRRPVASLAKQYGIISQATGIPSDYLCHKRPIWTASIAQRMSWAAARQTTRLEDRAYCLLGIFDVNLPLLYGEGLKAFLRLQLALIQESDDQTIFAWGIDRHETSQFGLLAQSPVNFAGSENVVISQQDPLLTTEPTQVTNQGISYSYLAGNCKKTYWGYPRDRRLRLLCALREPSNDDVDIILRISPPFETPRRTFTRVEVKRSRKPRTFIFRLFNILRNDKETVHIAYTNAFEPSGETVSQPRNERIPHVLSMIVVILEAIWPSVRLFSAAGLIALWTVSITHDWNYDVILLVAGMILIRDLIKGSHPAQYMKYVADFFLIFAGVVMTWP